eukprot:scaffold8923_cov67-Phaeocystis_antarctica.AAC.13
MALWASYRRHSCFCAAREASWAKPCTRRARLLAVAGLVKGGRQAVTGRDVVVIDVVDEVYLAACGGRSASRVILATRLTPDLALGRGHPVARWRGQHVGCGASRAQVEIRAVIEILRNAGGGQTGAEARGTDEGSSSGPETQCCWISCCH